MSDVGFFSGLCLFFFGGGVTARLPAPGLGAPAGPGALVHLLGGPRGSAGVLVRGRVCKTRGPLLACTS